jgi:4-diphosphocytidyl-2-C-methyl-D-erythritol kinase
LYPKQNIQIQQTKIISPAKINLFLQVIRKRSDGYHELVTLMCLIGLCDIVTLNFEAKDIQVSCTDLSVPTGETNLAYRAAKCFFDHLKSVCNRTSTGLDIAIEKQIPVGAGLGGGSSNAAAVLLGLNRYYGQPFSQEKILAMGLTIGADVPFFIYGKTALARGVGEKLEIYRRLNPFHVVLVFPGYRVSTAEVFQTLNLGLTKCEKKINSISFIKQTFDARRHLCNDLETVTALCYPDIHEAKKALVNHGAEGALMSGSGPTVFGLFVSKEKAQVAGDGLKKKRSWQTIVTDLRL